MHIIRERNGFGIFHSPEYHSQYFFSFMMDCFAKRKKEKTSQSPSWPFLFVKIEFWKICYSCYFCHIYTVYSLLHFFSHSKKNSSYFCDFCDICYFFYAFLIAVFFKSFLLKWQKQFASKCLLTRSTLDISDKVKIMSPELIFGVAWSVPVAFHSSLAK